MSGSFREDVAMKVIWSIPSYYYTPEERLKAIEHVFNRKILSGEELRQIISNARERQAADMEQDANPVEDDNINPPHYKSHPSGVQCIEITRHMSFNLGNAVKYIWRADLKGNAIEDLSKAVWYLQDEIKRRESVRKTDVDS